ncbi:mechanosensitive ion channel family protein [Ramlibacter sp.]|uniref:mechanosensitive ion channel family protein n=1 Tax=Ramlibacter sp. TaxID=1917967 RepID=UPI0035B4A1E5
MQLGHGSHLRLSLIALARLLALWLACASWAFAQSPGPQPGASSGPAGGVAAEAAAPPEAPVRFANRTITTLRGTFVGVDPQRRARRAEAVLKELAHDAGPDAVMLRVEPQGHALLVEGELVLVLTEADADRLRSQTLGQASAEAADRLRRALAETQESRNWRRMAQAIAFSLLATALAVAVAWLIWHLRRRATRWLAHRVARRAQTLHVAGAQLVQAERAAAVARSGLALLATLLIGALAFEWLGFVLRQFPYTRPWGEGLLAFLLGLFSGIGGGVVEALPGLVVAAVIFGLARGIVVLMRPFFARVAAGGRRGGWLDADTARPTQRLFSLGVAVFAVVMAYPYLPGSGSEAFKGISVLLGLMVTIGGSNLFSQAASGLVLLYSRTLRIGEYVRIGEHEGTVTETGAFTTRLRTGLGEELTLPNALVLGSVTRNYSRAVDGPGFVVDTVVTIGYDTPWRQVEAMLIEAARGTPGVLADPPPQVFQTALTDFYPEYRLVCQARAEQPRPRAEVLSRLHARIQDVFNTHGVQIMSPHYRSDPAQPKIVPPGSWYEPPARPPVAQGEPPA